ncbi:hypothetical protein H5410_032046 [Solanum commersonii]|uniref:Uncharacterized protein n=1 Tax=Solanum commersonii TaxID=4109 RepID=A0A9J5YNH9_SOLCO|nr:hypothetical protein H5410_032046 [Solanum commersonii]
MDKFLIKKPRSSSDLSVSSHVAPEAQRETITSSSSNVDCILGVGSLKRDPEKEKLLTYDGTNKIGSNLVSCLFACKVGFDFACCYGKCGKSILLNEAHQK